MTAPYGVSTSGVDESGVWRNVQGPKNPKERIKVLLDERAKDRNGVLGRAKAMFTGFSPPHYG